MVEEKKFDEARDYALRGLTARRTCLGSQHPDVALSLNNLGALYQSQKSWDLAEKYCKEALELRIKVYQHHPDVADSLYNLGLLYNTKKDYVKAEEYLQKCLVMRQQLLGKHKDVVSSLYLLATLYQNTKKLDKCFEYYEKTIVLADDISVDEQLKADILYNYGLFQMNSMQQLDKAKDLFTRALNLREKILGKEHVLTQRVVFNLERIQNKS